MMSITFKELRVANEARAAFWKPANGGSFSFEFRMIELAGEVGEACNIAKKMAREKLGAVGSRATQAEIEDELADVVITADLAAMSLGIDLGSAVARKFNKTSRKHAFSIELPEQDSQ